MDAISAAPRVSSAPTPRRSWLTRLASRCADFILPPQCLLCETGVARRGALCPACWVALRLIERPFCERLGLPFAYDAGRGALSAEAIAEPPPFGRLRAVAAFEGGGRDLVHRLKYRDRLDLAPAIGGWMARAGSDLLDTADVVVPVPLHRRRLWQRRFNQSAALAAAVARAGGRPYRPLALERVKPTRRQVGLSATQRQNNVRGAFAVAPRRRAEIAGRHVLLVDDVYTTGATAKAATRALLRAGASGVDVVVFARVVRD
ncbi:MAG: ComF family protein [Bauldia sp.]